MTVGRFRKFVEAYVGNGVDGGTATVPAEGAGANPNVPVQPGSSSNGTGWFSTWDVVLPASQAELKKLLAYGLTWTDSVGANESLAISGVSWYEAFAFCIWDGGRLPTESEWEYAAAGGAENRIFPWGSSKPDCTYANFLTSNPSAYCAPSGKPEVTPVGSYPLGNGRWGHMDLGGNINEWNFDYWNYYSGSTTINYAEKQPFIVTGETATRVMRGGQFNAEEMFMQAAYRNNRNAYARYASNGMRCARTAQ